MPDEQWTPVPLTGELVYPDNNFVPGRAIPGLAVPGVGATTTEEVQWTAESLDG